MIMELLSDRTFLEISVYTVTTFHGHKMCPKNITVTLEFEVVFVCEIPNKNTSKTGY